VTWCKKTDCYTDTSVVTHFYDTSDRHIRVQMFLCFCLTTRVFCSTEFSSSRTLCTSVIFWRRKRHCTSVTSACFMFGSSGLGNCWFQTSGLSWILGVHDRYAGLSMTLFYLISASAHVDMFLQLIIR
jgi:hypothetical protein